MLYRVLQVFLDWVSRFRVGDRVRASVPMKISHKGRGYFNEALFGGFGWVSERFRCIFSRKWTFRGRFSWFLVRRHAESEGFVPFSARWFA